MSHPLIIKGQAAADAVKAAGGTGLEQTMEFMRVVLDGQRQRERLLRFKEHTTARVKAERTVRAQWGDYLP